MEKIVLSLMSGAIIGSLISFLFFNKENKKLKEENFNLKVQNTENSTKLEIIKNFQQEKSELLELIKNDFTSIAAQTLLEKNKIIREENKTALETYLNPLKENIKEFKQKADLMSETGKINTALLKDKIEELTKETKITYLAAEKLSEAISKNSKSRGILGEMILEKLLKSSGLINKKENFEKGNFETQKGFKPKDGGNIRIVDAIIYLPNGNKNIIIDSKAPLAEFLNYTENYNEDSLNNFYKDVKNRIDELTGKYENLEEINTPDFTIMFIPFELPLSYIYSNNKLIEYALSKNIVVSGPSTLIATLRTINYCWSQKNQYENIKDITKLGLNIYEKMIVFIQKLEELKTSFDTVQKRFDSAFKTIKGQGSLIGQVEKLKNYGLIPPRNIETKYLEENIEINN